MPSTFMREEETNSEQSTRSSSDTTIVAGSRDHSTPTSITDNNVTTAALLPAHSNNTQQPSSGSIPVVPHSSSLRRGKSREQALLRAQASLTSPASFARRTGGVSSSSRPLHVQQHNTTSLSSSSNLPLQNQNAGDLNANLSLLPPSNHSSDVISSFPATTTVPQIIMPSSTSSSSFSTAIGSAMPKTTQGKWYPVQVSTDNNNHVNITQPHSSSSEPCARSLHAAAICNSKMFIFGGYNGTSRLNDFYSFDFIHKTWTQNIGSTGTPPSPRDRHCSVVYQDGFYVFGGFDGHARVNDLHRYDIVSGEWSRILPSWNNTTVPTPRHSHCAVVYKDSMLVFGGYDGSYRCDLFEYNFLTNSWRCIETMGRIPRARYRATCVVYGDFMILHGGHDGTRHLSDTHVLDLRNMSWATLVSTGIVPMHRDSHIAFLRGSSMYIFGGSAGGTAMNDMHELSLEGLENDKSSTWKKVICHGTARPRFCHVGACFEDSLYSFGGYDGQSRLSDFERFEFDVDDLSHDLPPSTLLHDLHSFVNNKELSDVTFILEGQSIYAHKMMLVRSPYFRIMFSGNMMESKQTEIHIKQVRAVILIFLLRHFSHYILRFIMTKCFHQDSSTNISHGLGISLYGSSKHSR
mmetsp:Transcript_2116/g.3876  ORF Transcript_2116/g.3876 Transcript_2116/m.3876 type:complete len:633 (+) Transcript_2116:126-2024(+)